MYRRSFNILCSICYAGLLNWFWVIEFGSFKSMVMLSSYDDHILCHISSPLQYNLQANVEYNLQASLFLPIM